MATTKEGFVSVNGMITKVLTNGGWVEDPLPSKHLIILIPGNPGVTGFYGPLLQTIHAKCGIPAWALSHGGFELPPGTAEELKNNLHNYNLLGQTKHKIAFIEQYVPKDVSITLIGHSIGCKMILDLMKTSEISNQIHKCYLLFPTIERMVSSPNGKFLTGTIKPFVFIILAAAWFLHIFPKAFVRTVINWFTTLMGYPADNLDSVIQVTHPNTARNAFYLGFNEMDTVNDLDTEPIRNYGDKLLFYYGARDDWVPLEYYLGMKRDFPDVNVQVCEKGINHAFMLEGNSETMGSLVAGWLQEHRM